MPSHLETLLAEIRRAKTCELRQGSYVTDEFLSIPPHRVGILHLAMVQRFLLADPVGCGKTPQALVAYGYLKEKDPTLRMIVVTTKSALFQWRAAVKKFLRKIDASVPGYSEKGSKQGTSSRHWQWNLDQRDVLVTTYHTLARDVNALLPAFDNFVLVLDEVQTVRNTQQTQLWPSAQKLSLKARYVWGLSATPIMNRLEDLFAVYEAIYPGLLGGSLTRFRQTYITEVLIRPKQGRPFWKVTGYQNLDQLKAIIEPFRLMRSAAEINQYLPPVVPKQVMLDMSPKQRALYDRIVMKVLPNATSESGAATTLMNDRTESAKSPANVTLDNLGEWLDDEGESASIPEGRRLTKLASLTYAQLAADAPAVLGFDDVPSVKWQELERFLTDECANNEKVIVYTKFERVVTWLSAQLKAAGITSTRITGVESAKVREANRVRFQTDPTMQVMVIDGAGGQALDLQAAGVVVFYDLPWGWGEFIQILGRARRVGTSHLKVLAVLLTTTDSIDTDTVSLLNKKETLADLILSLPNDAKVFTAIEAQATTHATTTAQSSDLSDLFNLVHSRTRTGKSSLGKAAPTAEEFVIPRSLIPTQSRSVPSPPSASKGPV